jgi:hypothetical protein
MVPSSTTTLVELLELMSSTIENLINSIRLQGLISLVIYN